MGHSFVRNASVQLSASILNSNVNEDAVRDARATTDTKKINLHVVMLVAVSSAAAGTGVAIAQAQTLAPGWP